MTWRKEMLQNLQILLLLLGQIGLILAGEDRTSRTSRVQPVAVATGNHEYPAAQSWVREIRAEKLHNSLGDFLVQQRRTAAADKAPISPKQPYPAACASPCKVAGATSNSHSSLDSSLHYQESVTSTSTEWVVNQMGAGDFRTVQEAIDAVPSGNQQRVVIKIDSGTYLEKVNISSGKDFIKFLGDKSGPPVITWNDTSASAGSTYNSATVAIDADNFIAEDIVFENSAPAPPAGASGMQAVALRIGGDMAAFYGSTFLGAQDTLCDWMGRHYFKNCSIQGSIDFIFGAGQSLYEECTIKSIASDSGSITAHYRQDGGDASGYSFINCTIDGTGSVLLGRAWGPFARVVFSSSTMSGVIDPVGWNDWGESSRDTSVFFGEYKNVGAGANLNQRVAYSQELNDSEAAPFLSTSWIDGQVWLPASD